MHAALEKLKSDGNDVDGFLARLRGKEDRYLRYLSMFREDTSYEELKQSMEKKDYQAAFAAAHTLKGVAGNVGLDRLFVPSSVLTEKLRVDDHTGIEDDFTLISEEYKKAMEAINLIER